MSTKKEHNEELFFFFVAYNVEDEKKFKPLKLLGPTKAKKLLKK